MDFKRVLSDICSLPIDNQEKLSLGPVKLKDEVLFKFH